MNTASSLSLNFAEFRAQTFSSLLGSGPGSALGVFSDQSTGISFASLMGSMLSPAPATDATVQAGAVSIAGLFGTGATPQNVAGRNMSLTDPESAFRMMSAINRYETDWKAEFAELSEMDKAVEEIGAATAEKLADIASADSAGAVKAQMKDFIERYNDLVERFRPDIQAGGLLERTQAARIALHELEASVRNILNGSQAGIHGLQALGVSVDKQTHQLTLDERELDSALASDPQAVTRVLSDFGSNFATAAKTVAADDKFIGRQLDNLDRALDYLRDNLTSLRQEFGTGDPARPSQRVAQAVSAYERMGRI